MKIPNRLKFLRRAVSLGFLAGIFFSRELWFPYEREFPRAPLVFGLPENFAAAAEWILSGALVFSLVFLNFPRRSEIFSLISITSLALLVALDQTRLQPWVYQYILLLVVLTSRGWRADDEPNEGQTLALAQIVVAALYFWSGVQKLNYTFSHETLPFLLAPLESFLPVNRLPLVFLSIGAATLEASIGVGLLSRRTRNLAVILAVVMHVIILGLLVAKNYNSIVWIWNAALVLIVFVSFWKSDASVLRTILESFDRKLTLAKTLVAASVLLPVLSFWNWWDAYLSGALYSGNVETAVVRINDKVIEKLPPKASQSVFQVKSSGEKMLPVLEWAIAELNVPAYPEKRVSKTIARRVCELTNDKRRVELIVKERPAILDGTYKVERVSCADLER